MSDRPLDIEWETVPDISAADSNSDDTDERSRKAGESARNMLAVILMFLAYFSRNLRLGCIDEDNRDETILLAELIFAMGLGRMRELGRRAAGATEIASEEETEEVANEAKSLDAALVVALDETASGDLRGDPDRRMDLYAAPLKKQFWTGFGKVMAGEGGMITWRMNPRKEHCSDCARFASISPMTADQFVEECLSRDMLPQSYNLECKGFNCGCWLESGSAENNETEKEEDGQQILSEPEAR